MFESIAITVVTVPAVLELKAVRRAPARTPPPRRRRRPDYMTRVAETPCRIVVLGRAAAARTARVINPPEKNLLGYGGADARPVELLPRRQDNA